ncbi:CHAT domain-containing protein [Sorangium sp. So ce448]|uniref:CHAT domain-containing protein n=1 Tax=Sorangium sp. So ce448 TaxID=3133314 RepID=UPI003F618DFA
MDLPFWLEIELELHGAELRLAARGSRGERLPSRSLGSEITLERLTAFTKSVGHAVSNGQPLGAPALSEARALHAAVFQGELRDVAARLIEAAKDRPLLQRLLLCDPVLQAFPWEALCQADTSEGFWGSSPRVLLARSVAIAGPWEPREVAGAVRVLAIVPSGEGSALRILKEALSDQIEAGEIEWLDPITGPRAGQRFLFEQLRRSKSPHIVHFLGHGTVAPDGRPMLRLADEDGEEARISAGSLAQELSASFGEDLRLVVLEACEGAAPGAFGSAAEILARAGADAVVAHLWPVEAGMARLCSKEFYRTLTGSGRAHGDVAASLASARRTMLLQSAEGFSPVLTLRGPGATIFDFERRKVSPPVARRALSGRARSLAPALQGLLERPFSMVLGDHGQDNKSEFRRELQRFLAESGDPGGDALSLSALTQRCALRFGQEKLYEVFQDALHGKLDAHTPPLVASLGRLLRPGVHVTLLWLPLLERAIAEHQPDRTVYVIQPSLLDTVGKPRVVKRAGGAKAWTKLAGLPNRFDRESDLVVLRLYGGYLPEPRPVFTSAMLTEDQHIHGLIGVEGFRPPEWADGLMGWLRNQPGLFVGLSVLEWRHRMLLRWLYDQRPAPKGSLSLLNTRVDPAEQEIWESGGGLPGTGRIAALREEPDELSAALAAVALPEATTR